MSFARLARERICDTLQRTRGRYRISYQSCVCWGGGGFCDGRLDRAASEAPLAIVCCHTEVRQLQHRGAAVIQHGPISHEDCPR